MQAFKKTIFAVLSIVAVVAVLCIAIIEPWMHSSTSYYQDAVVRESLAGSVDCLIIGASQSLAGVVPDILDSQLDLCSYNLSNSLMTVNARLWMAEKELQRNPVKMVIIDFSHDMLSRNTKNEQAEGDATTMARLQSWGERISYMVKNVGINDWLNVLAQHLISGVRYWFNRMLGRMVNDLQPEMKGYAGNSANDVSLPVNQIHSTYNTVSINETVYDTTLQVFDELVSLCQSYGCRVIVIGCPLADSFLWKCSNMDYYSQIAKTYCDEKNIEFYDFNLLKDDYMCLEDSKSFSDVYHLSVEGSCTFTSFLCQLIKDAAAGVHVSERFYSSYEEAKLHSSYYPMMNL